MNYNNNDFDIEIPFVTNEQKFEYWQQSKKEIKRLQVEIKRLKENIAAIVLLPTLKKVVVSQ